MAKSRKVLNANNKRNLIIVAIVLIVLGLAVFLIERQKAKKEMVEAPATTVSAQELPPLAPDDGCHLSGSNHVCDIKITNPSDEALEWTALVSDIDGATVSGNATGTIDPRSSAIVQLNVPESFCTTNPEGQGLVTIMDATQSSNQAEATFSCNADGTRSNE